MTDLMYKILSFSQAELHNIIDLKDADMVRASDRRKLRIADEETNFDDDYYLYVSILVW